MVKIVVKKNLKKEAPENVRMQIDGEARIHIDVNGKIFRFYIKKDFVLIHRQTTINDVTFVDSLHAKVGELNDDGSIYQVELKVVQ